MQSLQDAHDPSEIDIDAYRKLWNDGLSLLQKPDLPDAARADLSHTHGYARHFETVPAACNQGGANSPSGT